MPVERVVAVPTPVVKEVPVVRVVPVYVDADTGEPLRGPMGQGGFRGRRGGRFMGSVGGGRGGKAVVNNTHVHVNAGGEEGGCNGCV